MTDDSSGISVDLPILARMESFSHIHYKVQFLKITSESMEVMRNRPKDLLVHGVCFRTDLINAMEIEILTINLLKSIFYYIYISSIQEHKYVDDSTNSKNNSRNQYSLKAIAGIKKLALGMYFPKF